jgi:hypothetical protein
MPTAKTVYQNATTWVARAMNSVLSALKIVLVAKRAPELSKLKNRAASRCVVLGSGPSLKETMTLHGRAENTSYLAVNTFVFSDYFEIMKPEYYVILDPGMWMSDSELPRKVLRLLQSKTHWKMHLLVPFSARNTTFIRELMKHPHIEVRFVNYVVCKGFPSVMHFFFRRNLAMPQSQNVLVAALFLATNIGYKDIELWGADHDWHKTLFVNDQNVVCVKQIHFYESEQEVKYVPFYKGLQNSDTFRMDEIFFAWAKVFYGYHVLRDYAKSCGTTIRNATPGSFVDAFERIK